MIDNTTLILGILIAAGIVLFIGLYCLWRKLKKRSTNNLNNKPMPKAYVEIPDKTDR